MRMRPSALLRNSTVIKSELALVADESFCFYFCDKPSPAAALTPLYQNFERMPFATTYATSNALEDFTETFAFVVNQESQAFEKSYKLPDGYTINLTERFATDALSAKREFIRNFLNQPQIAYP